MRKICLPKYNVSKFLARIPGGDGARNEIQSARYHRGRGEEGCVAFEILDGECIYIYAYIYAYTFVCIHYIQTYCCVYDAGASLLLHRAEARMEGTNERDRRDSIADRRAR